MPSPLSPERLEGAYQKALAALLAERTPQGHWAGELSTSALSTATAVSALALVQRHFVSRHHDTLISGGLAWLAAHQNADGGWGDTVRSISNISTTMLSRSAFYLAEAVGRYAECVRRAEDHLAERHGQTPEALAEAVRGRYGKDRTFSVPILTTAAIAGLVPWSEVPPLPFELACWPQWFFRFLRLQVVSYALPALIALGQAVHHHRPPRNPVARVVRALSRKRSLRVLERIQPSSGGFLEATPLTSFVTLSLAACGLAEHPVAMKGVEFLVRSVRRDGSWPIDTNLATWVTTLAVNALAVAGELDTLDRTVPLRDWLLGQQYRTRHPYTGADPGAWAWTDLPGGVPDCDDTAGALYALFHLPSSGMDEEQALAGLRWLWRLQNRDGGFPTFCRGWSQLPFDRSGSDLTAHALRALASWWRRWMNPRAVPTAFARNRIGKLDARQEQVFGALVNAIPHGLLFLSSAQRPDGSWLPLWFGNQHAHDDENPTYGTARVLAAYRDLDMMNTDPARRGVAWLLAAQNADGGWGAGAGTASSMEETALAVEVLLGEPGALAADCQGTTENKPGADAPGSPLPAAVNKGLAWLVEQVETGGLDDPTPIGFYFAKLWYFEKLYPIIFSVAALGRARRKRGQKRASD
jgi:squalene-hopene/tetraprenyl-beta-curcumene cyclase